MTFSEPTNLLIYYTLTWNLLSCIWLTLSDLPGGIPDRLKTMLGHTTKVTYPEQTYPLPDDLPRGGEIDVVREHAHPVAPVRQGDVGYCDVTVAPPPRYEKAWLSLAHLARHILLQHTTFFLSEPLFLNVYGAQESIPRNEFRQPT
jgi:hypothetical protein